MTDLPSLPYPLRVNIAHFLDPTSLLNLKGASPEFGRLVAENWTEEELRWLTPRLVDTGNGFYMLRAAPQRAYPGLSRNDPHFTLAAIRAFFGRKRARRLVIGGVDLRRFTPSAEAGAEAELIATVGLFPFLRSVRASHPCITKRFTTALAGLPFLRRVDFSLDSTLGRCAITETDMAALAAARPGLDELRYSLGDSGDPVARADWPARARILKSCTQLRCLVAQGFAKAYPTSIRAWADAASPFYARQMPRAFDMWPAAMQALYGIWAKARPPDGSSGLPEDYCPAPQVADGDLYYISFAAAAAADANTVSLTMLMNLCARITGYEAIILDKMPYLTNAALEAFLREMPQLKVLCLHDCNALKSTAVPALLEQCPALEVLSLRGANVTSDWLDSLCEAPPPESLKLVCGLYTKVSRSKVHDARNTLWEAGRRVRLQFYRNRTAALARVTGDSARV